MFCWIYFQNEIVNRKIPKTKKPVINVTGFVYCRAGEKMLYGRLCNGLNERLKTWEMVLLHCFNASFRLIGCFPYFIYRFLIPAFFKECCEGK